LAYIEILLWSNRLGDDIAFSKSTKEFHLRGSADLHLAIRGRGCKQPGRSRFGSLKTNSELFLGQLAEKPLLSLDVTAFLANIIMYSAGIKETIP